MVVVGHQAATASQEPICQLWVSICAKTLSQSQSSDINLKVLVCTAQNRGTFVFLAVVFLPIASACVLYNSEIVQAQSLPHKFGDDGLACIVTVTAEVQCLLGNADLQYTVKCTTPT